MAMLVYQRVTVHGLLFFCSEDSFFASDILHQLRLGSLSHYLPRLLYIADGIGVQQIEYS